MLKDNEIYVVRFKCIRKDTGFVAPTYTIAASRKLERITNSSRNWTDPNKFKNIKYEVVDSPPLTIKIADGKMAEWVGDDVGTWFPNGGFVQITESMVDLTEDEHLDIMFHDVEEKEKFRQFWKKGL